MHDKLKAVIVELLKIVGVTGPIELTNSPNSEMGDVAFACFNLAKERQQSPVAVSAMLVTMLQAELAKHQFLIERVATVGPYVNFFFNNGQVAELIVGMVLDQGEQYGHSRFGEGQSALIEYPSNNTHKEFHIGHFRNVCIGNALTQLYRSLGFTMHVVNYLNDFGAHVARCLWGIQKFYANDKPLLNKQKWLGEIYAKASTYVTEHPEAGVEVALLQKKLEEKDSQLWPLFMETRQWSIDKFNELFAELGVAHEVTFFEKDIKPLGQAVVDQLLKQGVAQVGEGGAIIADLTEYKLDIALLRKSNGAGVYFTADLALAEEKFKRFVVEESIVVTGQEQTFYFRQLFKILELLGFDKKMRHIGYGLVNLPEGKMASRTGNVILYEDLRDQVYQQFHEETTARHPDWSPEQASQTAHILTLSALKFDMQKHEAAKNIIFDIKEATSFEGFSAPYVLYVVARINSLLKKQKITSSLKHESANFVLLTSAEEKNLVLLMAELEGVIKKAFTNYNPSVMARYCFDVAQAFNDFYNRHSVLNADNQKLISARLALADAVKQVLENALRILTIETVSEM